MSPLEFLVKFVLSWIGLSLLLAWAMGSIMEWLETDHDE